MAGFRLLLLVTDMPYGKTFNFLSFILFLLAKILQIHILYLPTLYSLLSN